jgi:signal transduction histidine kinase
MTPRDGLPVYGGYVRTNTDVTAARQRPPLSKRLSARHWAALDYLAAALCGVILLTQTRRGVVQAAVTPYGVVQSSHTFSLARPMVAFLIIVSVVAVATRRRRPVLMLGLLLATSLAVSVLTVPQANAMLYCFLPIAYVLYLVAATYEHRQAAIRVVAAVLATLAADTTLVLLSREAFFWHAEFATTCLVLIMAWSSGYVVRQRRRYAVSLQDEAASKAVAVERLRIARELHDVVAHSMSVIAVQAGYGQYVIDSQPADARSALSAIQATSREALDEMRRMLGALRQADESGLSAVHDGGSPGRSVSAAGAAPLSPAPGLAALDRLLARTASAGVQVEIKRRGTARELPASIDLSAYRIIQEALTNVVKHARTSSCQVLIGFGQDELLIEVADNGAGVPALAGAAAGGPGTNLGPGAAAGAVWSAPAGAGHGIVGMRERVSLLGGEFTAGPRPGYGFGVCAHIPLPPGPG